MLQNIRYFPLLHLPVGASSFPTVKKALSFNQLAARGRWQEFSRGRQANGLKSEFVPTAREYSVLASLISTLSRGLTAHTYTPSVFALMEITLATKKQLCIITSIPITIGLISSSQKPRKWCTTLFCHRFTSTNLCELRARHYVPPTCSNFKLAPS